MRPRAEDVFGLPRLFGTAEMMKKGSAAALASQPECAEEGGTGEIRPLRKRKRCRLCLKETKLRRTRSVKV